MDEIPGQLTQKLIVGTLEHSSKGGIDETDASLFVHQQNTIWRMLQYGAGVRADLVF
jgi:hypothetical protein